MAITEYTDNGDVLFEVYVQVRSKTKRNIRLQKRIKRIKFKAEALKIEKKLIRDLASEVSRIDNLGETWGDVLHLWAVDVKAGYVGKISIKCANEYLSTIYKWTSSWQSRIASEITRADGRDLLIRLEKAGLSCAYQKKIKNIVSKVYDWGIEYRHILGVDSSPFKGLLVQKTVERPPDIFSLEEIKKFLGLAKAMDHPWYSVWAFAILTGMRSGELNALTWDQIDLEKDLILCDRSWDSNGRELGPTKGRYWRTIPINSSLKKLILDLKSGPNSIANGHVLPRFKVWDYGDQAVPLKCFLKSINMKPIKFHALRACFATQMLANGISAPVVMKIGGWKNSKTMDIYLRLAGVDTKGATDCLQFIPNEISFSDNVVSISSRADQ